MKRLCPPALTLYPTIAQESPRIAEQELARIATLPASAQPGALRTVINDRGLRIDDPNEFFYQLAILHTPLTSLLSDPELGVVAATQLAALGFRKGIDQILPHLSLSTADKDGEFLEDFLCLLTDPESETEWALLRVAARDELDRNAFNCALQALKLNASPKSLRILSEAHPSDDGKKQELANTLLYARTHGSSRRGTDLPALTRKVAQAVWTGEDFEIKPLRHDQSSSLRLRCLPLIRQMQLRLRGLLPPRARRMGPPVRTPHRHLHEPSSTPALIPTPPPRIFDSTHVDPQTRTRPPQRRRLPHPHTDGLYRRVHPPPAEP